MLEKLNIPFFATLAVDIVIPQQAVWKRICRFVTPDLVLLPALGFFWTIVLCSMVNTFFTTFIPSPCLPTVISTAISVSKVSRGYLGVAQALWQCSGEANDINALSVLQVGSQLEQAYASV
ncbi:MAG: hypothetical protein F6K54_00290 [Okeania sp. SIO3B5]|uniref:hypothetical protein n=1 Tax=Okeania sp. SIO3B5 TaxID=2607811 RepID=UPI0013FFE20E|nr:hypothetical protein [Okeania sp. SIO3B5]NEO51672.1 hypothetical protein [Okeania sp. SIO3B5]